jgi:outer membrane protein TolC
MIKYKTLNSTSMPSSPKIPGIPLLAILLLIIAATPVLGQILPTRGSGRDSVQSVRRSVYISDSLVQEKLVMLALQGPQYQITNHQIKVSQYQLSNTKKSWLNLLSLSANFNDQTFAKTPEVAVGNTEVVYPKYFFGVTVPLGVIFSLGGEIKGSRENVEVAINNQEQTARKIRADVLSKYKQYKNFGQLIGLQTVIVDDEQAAVAASEKKFRDGSISIDQYTQLSKAYNNDLAQKLNLQLSQDMVKLEIEEMIGTSLENVIK